MNQKSLYITWMTWVTARKCALDDDSYRLDWQCTKYIGTIFHYSVWLTRETYGRVFLVISEWECDRADYGIGVWTKQLDQWPGDPYDGAGPNRCQWDRQTPLHRSRIHCTVYLCVGCPLQWVGHTGTAQEITVSGKRRMNFYSFKRSLYIWITRLVSFSLRDPYKSCGFYVIYRI